MVKRTKSESMFEQFCNDLCIKCIRIEEGKEKRPDYEIVVGSSKMIVEVKQIDPNDEEKIHQKKLENGQTVSSTLTPGERVRKKIHEANRQLKEFLNDRNVPCILVLLNNTFHHQHTEPYFISTAMKGFDELEVLLPRDMEKEPKMGEVYSGQSKALTQKKNTTISAVAVINFFKEPFCLDVYHNRYAKNPIKYGILNLDRVKQFKLRDKVYNSLNEPWEEI